MAPEHIWIGLLSSFLALMKGTLIFISVLALCVYHVDAFLPLHYRHPRLARHYKHSKSKRCGGSHARPVNGDADFSMGNELPPFTHDDILWKVRPPPETRWWRRLLLRLAANTLRLDCFVKRQDPPFVLCPKGGQAVLQAYCRKDSSGKPSRRRKIARFGISTARGPPAPPIDETVEHLYGIDLEGKQVGTAAIIYMFVEPPYRKRGLGTLALDVISTVHSAQGCDFTLLVADDDGSGKLIKWYEQRGFSRAPQLQDLLGSPNGKYGITMIKPTSSVVAPTCRLQWW